MSSEINKIVLDHSLDGIYAHVLPSRAVEALTIELASRKAEGFPHTIFQIIEHMNYWQDIFLKDVYKTDYVKPEHASDGWTAIEAPKDEQELKESIEKFLKGIDDAKQFVKNVDDSSRTIKQGDNNLDVYDVLHSLASHNSYHLGQVVMLRHLFGAWPPPSGGMTW
jgi:uncharacterized damage-inducible protein DinB